MNIWILLPYTLYKNTTGNNNTAIGTYSLYYNTTGINNTATGYYSLCYNTTGTTQQRFLLLKSIGSLTGVLLKYNR
ncbi:MAG: hypothetical protein IPH88_18040 [Bacteroidales bacterium]|nr:hypothetical protein [Bacteroidales bacterium]